MPGFKTHITFSSLLGVGYAGAAYGAYGVPLPTAILAGGLCSISGMLPDIDSDSGVPHRESLAFAAAVVPMMLVNRLQHFQWPVESIIIAGAGVYLFIRFAVAYLLKRFTAHRGMFHSIPAALVFGELAYLLASGDDPRLRCFIGGAVALGYLSHLCLDEVWSLDFRGGLHFKQSFGTALKLYTHKSMVANVSMYAKLLVLTFLVIYEPQFLQQVYHKDLPGQAAQITADLEQLQQSGGNFLRQGFRAARDATLRK
jgi:hypothetical protein